MKHKKRRSFFKGNTIGWECNWKLIALLAALTSETPKKQMGSVIFLKVNNCRH